MPATARQIPVSEEDLANASEGGGGGAYAELTVPDDYVAILQDVEDYDYSKRGKSKGWIFRYEVEAPSGKMLAFPVWLSLGQSARWKLLETLEAHDYPVEAGINNVDPNVFVSEAIGVHIDFGTDEDGEPSRFREIQRLFPLVDPPAVDVVEEEELEVI
jgi:hypothetical protein